MMKVALYSRVSTHDQQTLSLQTKAMKEYAQKRNWEIILQIEDIGSGASEREKREEIILAAKKRTIDVILVWKLDRWGRSMVDLVTTLEELSALGGGFVSITEALDLTTPSGKAMAGMLAVFSEFERDILRERIKAGIAHARAKGKQRGKPKTAALKENKVKELFSEGYNKSQIAKKLKIGRTSVIRILSQ